MISKRHCAIIQRDGKAFIRDFDSTNGTIVNETPVKGEIELHHDDQLKIGPILFAVRIEADAPAARATAGKTPSPATRPTKQPTPRPATSTPVPPAKAATPAAATPAPPSKPAPAPAAKAGSEGEDDMMSMLMSLSDDASPGDPPGDQAVAVPEGSTIMDLKLPAELAGGQAPPPKEEPKKNTGQGDTRAAAARILEQMSRRPRT